MKHVTVIGGGVAGLVAAGELDRLGHNVRVLEARPEPGGRVRTCVFGGDGGPVVELGAMRIPASHQRTMRLIERLELRKRLRRFRTLLSDDGNLLASAGDHQAAGCHNRVGDVSPALVDRFRAGLPAGHYYQDETVLCAAWLAASIKAVAPQVYLRGLGAGLNVQLMRLLDGVDVRPFLRQRPSLRLDLGRFLAVNRGLGAAGRLRYFFDDVAAELSDALLRLDGGMGQLVRGLADPLGERIRYNTWVIGLHVRPDCVLVEARHGAKTTVTACDYVLCTLPFSVLRRLRLSGISDEKLALIHDMPYWSAVKIAMHCREAFWERDGIAGGGSFVGGLVRQTYYPPVENDPRQGAAFLASYAIGPDAERIERLSRWERVVAVLGELAAIHPALSEPGMVLGVVAQAWGEDPTALGAASVRWSKDARTAQQQQELAARPQGRLFFAGEHCSSFPAWIEGAVESGEAASMEIHAFGPGAHRPPIRVSST